MAARPKTALALPTIVPSQVTSKLKNTREQREVVGPLVAYLISLGWSLDQLVFGRKEWLVPKSPSEHHKREKGQKFVGFPCDIAVFDSPKRVGDPRHLVMILEAKVPDEKAGVAELEAYVSREPYVQIGVWANTADPSAQAVFVFRDKNGNPLHRRRLLNDLPRPGDAVTPDQKRLTYVDLVVPTEHVLRRNLEDLLDRVVVEDRKVTRREEQLDQICNLLLLKLQSDKQAKLKPTEPPFLRPRETAARTGEELRKEFRKLVQLYPDTFSEQHDRDLRLSDDTIHAIVERLSLHRLLEASVSTISLGFQVLRSAALKQGEGQYFTPRRVIEAGLRLLNIDLEDLVIDPACGTGGFLVEVLQQMQQKFPQHGTEITKWAQTHIVGIDKDAIAVKLTKAIMQIAGDGSAHCVRGDSVRKHLWAHDYPHLQSPTFGDNRFTVVVTNPPFGKNLKVTGQDSRLAGLDIATLKKPGGHSDLEIGLLFLQRAHQLLRVGGRVGIVLPETYFFSPQYRFVLGWLRPRLKPKIVANIPMEAFQGFCRAKTNFYIFEKIG